MSKRQASGSPSPAREAATPASKRPKLTEADTTEDDEAFRAPQRQSRPEEGYENLYLDTVDRKALDFDFEKLCSVTLQHTNVYACLVCGKYYQGRGTSSQAYFHSLDVDHHVFINMETKKIYVLPEGYEVTNRTLDDIKFVVDPHYTREEVERMDNEPRVAWDLDNKQYVPGFVGMNNIKANDYFNVVIHALAHVVPIRNYFMLEDVSARPPLAQRFGTLVRKIWNPRGFKTHVSPHELLQEIALHSSKKFTLTDQADPADFLTWFLNELHVSIGGKRKVTKSSIIFRTFQGTMKNESNEQLKVETGDRMRFQDAGTKVTTMNYLFLPLDLPPPPLFRESTKDIIPQVALTTLLAKYNGIQAEEKLRERVCHRLLHPLPPYLIFHIKRFTRNRFKDERNPTIVTFQPEALDMSEYVEPNPHVHPVGEPILYDLIANITHEAVKIRDDSVEGEQDKKVWRVQLLDRSRDEWYSVQDLFVEKERPETLFTKESYIQIWQKRS